MCHRVCRPRVALQCASRLQVAYLDPGNWATAIDSGSRFGYSQLWLLILSNLIAIHLQALASRLGLVTGKHLAQVRIFECSDPLRRGPKRTVHKRPGTMCTRLPRQRRAA
jgi:Natural resistance-associated macrophage protein